MPKSYERAPVSAPTFRITMRHHTATDADASECSEKNSKSIRGGDTPRFAHRGRHSRRRCLPRSAWATFGCAESSYWHLRCQVLNHLFGGSKLLFRATLLPFLQRSRNRLVAYSIRQNVTWHFLLASLFVTLPCLDSLVRYIWLVQHRIICNIFDTFYRQNLRI